MIASQKLTVINWKVKKRKIFAFDVETFSNKNLFLCGSVVGKNLKKFFTNKESMKRYILNMQDAALFSTNLKFDLCALFDDEWVCFSPVFSQTIMIAAYHKTLVFMDTLAFAPFSVKKLGRIVGKEKLDYDVKKLNPGSVNDADLKAYNLNDAEITYLFAEFLQKTLNKLGCEMKLTIGSSAMNLFRRKFLRTPLYQPSQKILQMSRKAYYGGRTETFSRGTYRNVKIYDINSLYPYCMLRSFPDTKSIIYKWKCSKDDVARFEGLADVKVFVPGKLNYPPLPFRDEKTGKVIYPTGTFRGYYTFPELRNLQKEGGKILKIFEGAVCRDSRALFNDYVTTLYALRQKYKAEGSNMEIVIKLMMNSLYGKFGFNPEGKSRIIGGDELTWEMLEEIGRKGGNVTPEGKFFIISGEKTTWIPSFVNPLISAYVTAYGRIELLKYLKAYKALSCDTDSIFTHHNIPVSEALGGVKLENFCKKIILVKPKLYAYETGQKFRVVAKGLRDECRKEVCERCGACMERFKKLLRGGKFSGIRFAGVREAIRSKPHHKTGLISINEIIPVIKRLDVEDNKRIWKGRFCAEKQQKSRPKPLNIKDGL
jgi:DNA polymerase elongation subunit (family B)